MSHIDDDWPSEGLKPVANCPICGSVVRATLHESLVDHTFETAPGKWRMQLCGACGCCYLDPRPTDDTIYLAYANYNTHAPRRISDVGTLARFRRTVAESYANARYGMSFACAPRGRHAVAWLFPRLRRHLDVTYTRSLPAPAPDARRLLDVGCGNGEFLQCATALGWDAEGIDPDPDAIAAALAAGCRAKQVAIDDPSLEAASYHHITLSHVLEHVPEPVGQLARCYELLAPGGRIWLETPNVNSLGHRVFRGAWRGLEPPRHLVLFNRESLRSALLKAGFQRVQFTSHPAVSLFIWEESLRILSRIETAPADTLGRRLMRSIAGAVLADYWSILRPTSSEFLTCIAFRPSGDMVRR
ncbi:MAG: Methyltransferase type 11 [Proteobacteria bacterium]|nr:Methyltransferase type 11 [Pseudomonadota bacterium]